MEVVSNTLVSSCVTALKMIEWGNYDPNRNRQIACGTRGLRPPNSKKSEPPGLRFMHRFSLSRNRLPLGRLRLSFPGLCPHRAKDAKRGAFLGRPHDHSYPWGAGW